MNYTIFMPDIFPSKRGKIKKKWSILPPTAEHMKKYIQFRIYQEFPKFIFTLNLIIKRSVPRQYLTSPIETSRFNPAPHILTIYFPE